MFADPSPAESSFSTAVVAEEPPSKPAGLSVIKLVQSKYGAAIMTLVAVFALLILTRPPMIMRDISTNPYNKEYTINWTVVFIWCATAALVVLAIEPLIDVVKRYG